MALITLEQRTEELAQRRAFHDAVRTVQRRLADAEDAVRITKQLVLEGVHYRRRVLVPELGERAFLMIRPLSDREFTLVQQVILQGLKRGDLEDIELEVDGLVERERRGTYVAVSMALSCDGEEWTVDDVGRLPPGVPDRLYNHVALISGFPRIARPESVTPPAAPGRT